MRDEVGNMRLEVEVEVEVEEVEDASELRSADSRSRCLCDQSKPLLPRCSLPPDVTETRPQDRQKISCIMFSPPLRYRALECARSQGKPTVKL